jgi:YD repeat-containing protein
VGPEADATTVTYNLDHQVTEISRPDGQTITSTYGATTGRLESVATPRGTYGLTYHPVSGNLTTLGDPSGGSLAFTYDGPLVTGLTWSGEVSGSIEMRFNNHFELIHVSWIIATECSRPGARAFIRRVARCPGEPRSAENRL